MKKTIFSVAILLASTIGLSAVAQSPDNSKQCPAKTECAKADKAKKMNRPNPFEGLNLTEKQKSELQAIAPQKLEKKGDKAFAGKKDKNAKVDKKDNAKSKEEMQAMRAERRQKMIQARRDYLAKVKTILTPEQYVQFLENNYAEKSFKGGQKGNRQGKMQAKGPKGMKGKGMKGDRGMKGPKGEKAPKASEQIKG